MSEVCDRCDLESDRPDKAVCSHCQRLNTLYLREHRKLQPRKKPYAKQPCSLCREFGHYYPTCQLNPDNYA